MTGEAPEYAERNARARSGSPARAPTGPGKCRPSRPDRHPGTAGEPAGQRRPRPARRPERTGQTGTAARSG
ncbi:hypothetical protein GCM10022222_35780 [Amycolatopsis ultiminotia]|uniref:Uncharacterized protein n=1 Tax=Amycolatopsis ultiminotia TaxID=543629 RepID=A0ABP6WCV3_9PSEU